MVKPGKQIVPRDPLPSDSLGPAWNALSCDAYRVFAWARVVLGMNQAQAARLAGYACGTKDSARQQGHKLDQIPEIRAAKRELTDGLGVAEGPKSIRTIIKLRDSATDEKVRLAAARDLLDRFGHGAVNRVEHTHTVTLSEEQLDARIIQLARDAGLTEAEARKLLIDPSKVVDAEFEEVPPEPTPEQLAANARRRELAAMSPDQRAASKAEVRARRSAEQKAAYAAAQAGQTDIEDFLNDGSEGLEDLLAPANGAGSAEA